MQFTVNSKQLSDKLALVAQVLPKRAINPILENVMITASGNTITLSATNLEHDITAKLEANTSMDFIPGCCLVNALQLKNVMKSTNKNVDFSFTLTEIEDNDPYLLISDGVNTSKLITTAITEYPDFPKLTNFDHSFEKNAIVQVSKSLMHAVSKDGTKQILTAFNLAISGEFSTIATCDGHRLAVGECEIISKTTVANDLNINIPSTVFKYFEKITKLAKKETEVFLAVAKSDHLISFKIENDMITSRLHVGTYPNYKNLLPKQFTTTVEIETKPWIEAINFLKNFIPKTQRFCGSGIQILFNSGSNSCDLSVTVDNNTNTRTINDVKIKGDLKEIRFLPDYLLEAIEAIPTEYGVLNMNKNISPTVIKPQGELQPNLNDLTMLVMPYKRRED